MFSNHGLSVYVWGDQPDTMSLESPTVRLQIRSLASTTRRGDDRSSDYIAPSRVSSGPVEMGGRKRRHPSANQRRRCRKRLQRYLLESQMCQGLAELHISSIVSSPSLKDTPVANSIMSSDIYDIEQTELYIHRNLLAHLQELSIWHRCTFIL